ncbi:MAG: hypothetical protein J2P54_27095, partial [Bradyrhizobiaceae bacterium]|nr:hypothetical protein [Bradyrhizobiaceae bacterium]
FRSSFNKARDKAGITCLTFNDLRGTAVTRLALAGCTEAQIFSITGHSLNDVRSILDVHYLHRDPELARAAIHKLELGYAKFSKWLSKRSFRSNGKNGKLSMKSTGWGTRIRT